MDVADAHASTMLLKRHVLVAYTVVDCREAEGEAGSGHVAES